MDTDTLAAPAQLPLASHAVLRSRDFKETMRLLAAGMPSHTVVPLSTTEGIQGYVNRAWLGPLSFSVTGIGIPVAVHAKTIEDVYLIHVPLVGQVQARVNNVVVHAADSAGFILSPGSEMHLDMREGSVGLQVQVPAALLRSRLALLLGGAPKEPLVFTPGMPGNAARTRNFLGQLKHVVGAIEHGGLDSSLLVSETVNSLVSMLLLTHASNCSRWLDNGFDAVPGYLRRVEAFMAENLQRALTIQDLVRVAGVAERTLYSACVDHFGATPMRRHKLMRLHAVRQRLTDGAVRGETVTGAAMDHGFYQLGKFAAEYNDAFGELPSETLRRHQGPAHLR